MEFAKEKSPVAEIITPLVESLDLQVVECSHSQQGKYHTIRIVLFGEQGIGTDQCADVYRLVMPRLEIHLDSKDISLEVSSPGIQRRIKSNNEFTIFVGKSLRVLSDGSWIEGTICSASDADLTLTLESGESRVIPFVAIQKAVLHT